ncbi:MAG: DUF494 family protein [Polaromonas sp.]|nr:DUF494 family protein [Polaromonas sp.]
MFEVLVYVYENYWQGDACPAPRQLSRKLIAAGFESDEIEAALTWLNGLQVAAHNTRATGSNKEDAAPRPEHPVLLQAQSADSDDLKIIVLMVYWSVGEEPDALVLDELCEDAHYRVAH